MKKISIISAIILATSASSAFAVTGNIDATVVANLTVSQSTQMNFGSFSSSATSGTIDQAGNVTGGVTAVAGGATRAPAVFNVTGTGNYPYTFTLPATATIGIGGSGGTNPMTVTLSFATGNGSRTLSSGSENVTINGSLAVAANQAAGAYTGTYNVTANY